MLGKPCPQEKKKKKKTGMFKKNPHSAHSSRQDFQIIP